MTTGGLFPKNGKLAGVVGLTLVAVGCAAGGGETSSVAGQGASRGAAWCEAGRVPLTLADGTHPYVEPEALIRVGSAFVVAGSPTYTWGFAPDGSTIRRSANQHVAARFALDGRATLIEPPIPGGIGSVRAVALGGERWGMLFDEIPQDSFPSWTVLRGLWYAEHDGQAWSAAEPLPLPDQGTPDLSGATELVRTDQGLLWITPLRPTSTVVQYERRNGRWHHEVISDAQIEVSALAYRESAAWWAHFSEDPDLPGRQQSLRLFRRGATWELVQRVTVAGDGVKVRSPSVTPSPEGVTVSWRVESRGDLGAYAVVGIGEGAGGAPVALDPSVLGIMALNPPGGPPQWLVTHADEATQSVQLRLLSPGSPFGPRRLADTPSPFVAFQAALALSVNDVLVVGPEYDPEPPNSLLRSLILRLSTSCT